MRSGNVRDEQGCYSYCVLVPDFGFAWARRSDILEIKEWVIEMPLVSLLKVFAIKGSLLVKLTQVLVNAVGG